MYVNLRTVHAQKMVLNLYMLPVAMGNYIGVMISNTDGFEVQSLEETSKTKNATNKQTMQKK